MFPTDQEFPEILLVDDDPEMRDFLREALEDGGFSVREAPNGAAALRSLRERVPALVLLDHMLPDMLGRDVCRQIRSEPAFSAIPVVMLTGMSGVTDQIAGFEAGADDYVTKPFNLGELVARLRGHVRRTQRERQLSPLTGLPGNLAIDQAISARLAQGQPFAVAWIDIDHFKSYNDRYGFIAGDHIIERTGQLLCSIVDAVGGSASFAGHIGGDDFVLVAPLEAAENAARRIVAGFDALLPETYTQGDLERGYVVSLNRQGHEQRFPLMSVSVSVVPCPPGRFQHTGEVAQIASEIKHFLKRHNGSAWLIDRRGGERQVINAAGRDKGPAVAHIDARGEPTADPLAV